MAEGGPSPKQERSETYVLSLLARTINGRVLSLLSIDKHVPTTVRGLSFSYYFSKINKLPAAVAFRAHLTRSISETQSQ